MQQKEETKAVIFEHSKHEQVLFSDIAEVNITDENVAISFAVKSKDGKTAKISHVVYLTIPHFIRLADVCAELKNTFMENLNKRAEEYKKKIQESDKKEK